MEKLPDLSPLELPEGTVTFLFTDIEGSTRLLHTLGEGYVTLLSKHHRLLRAVFARWHGREVDTEGDAFFVSFSRATEAVTAVVEAQRTLAEHAWPEGVTVKVRMGLHTGEPWTAEAGYVGMDVHRAARIAHVGYGGQVLLSETTVPLVLDQLPKGVSLFDLGRHRLKDMQRPEHIRQLVIPGLPSNFPPLKSLEVLGSVEALAKQPVRVPDFLEEGLSEMPRPVFVGRVQEMERLKNSLDQAIHGQGGVHFVAGDAGSGKTTLLDAFARSTQGSLPDLLVARGSCNAFTGSGDPYSPFRAILRQLTGDVETLWNGGTISNEQALRLWMALPTVASALVKVGPDLVNTFVPGAGLVERISMAVPADGALIKQVRELARREKPPQGELEQIRLFEEVRDVLVEVARERPLLLLLDDMQWADSGSINLLFHLGRELAGFRVLLVIAYRPEEIALGRAGSRHPLLPILDELKRIYGAVWLDLNLVQGRHFVDELVDSESNRLREAFRDHLYRHTGGHALFTVELLRDLQERGDLVKDDASNWSASPSLDWAALPARVEGVIEARIGRLEEELRESLTIAAVEGEDFTAQVVARVQQLQERRLLRSLSRELEKRHHLIHEYPGQQIGSVYLSKYRFTHAMFQRYLYNELGEGERRLLHGEVAAILEELYADRLNEISIQLGGHYAKAGNGRKAVEYLLLAGDDARRLYAHDEAIDAYEQALLFLRELVDHRTAARTLMKLGATYHNTFAFEQAQQAYEEGFAEWQRLTIAGDQAEQSLLPAPHAFRIPSVGPPITLDPTLAGDTGSIRVVNLLFSGLLELTTNDELLPDVAQSWDVLDGGTRYVFHLRDDVRWSDGSIVTAGDFENAWIRILEPGLAPNNAPLLFDIQGAQAYHNGQITDPAFVGVKAADDQTLVVLLESPSSYFLQIMAIAKPIPSRIVERFGPDWIAPEKIVTNGPFRIHTWSPDKLIILERYPDYHGHFKGNLSQVQFTIAPPEDHLKLYQRDAVDGWNPFNIQVEDGIRAIQLYPDDHISGPAASTIHIVFDVTRPPFDDINARQAMALAIDRQTMVSRFLKGLDLPATGGFVPSKIPGHVPGIATPYDPGLASKKMAEAGYPGGVGFPAVALLVPRRHNPGNLFARFADQWRENLSVHINIHEVDFNTVLDRIYNDPPHMWTMGWEADYPDPDNFLRVSSWLRTSGWRDREYEALVGEAKQVNDQDLRMAKYKQAEQLLAKESPVVPIFYRRNHLLLKPWIASRPYSVINGLILKDVIIEDH